MKKDTKKSRATFPLQAVAAFSTLTVDFSVYDYDIHTPRNHNSVVCDTLLSRTSVVYHMYTATF